MVYGTPEPIFRRIVDMRRELHRHPELSWQEARTSRLIREALVDTQARLLPIAPREVGVVAEIDGVDSSVSVALRADLDALPIEEETGLDFSSSARGVMHACGHDGHSAMLLGAAMLLSRGSPPPCTVRLIWQPAEEVATGARAMVEAGALDGVRAIFGGHLDRHYPPGTICISEGPVNASTDLFTIDIHGREGHGARPHEALDAVVVGSLMVTALQTIVSREVNPAHPSVITVGTFQAGTAHNVIAGRARLGGTIRAQQPDVRKRLHQSISRIAQAIGGLHEAQVDVEITNGTPPLINRPPMVQWARQAAQSIGVASIGELHTPNMGGEDFAHYLEHVPGCYVRFGAQRPGRENYPAHSSRFDFDERALGLGAAWFAAVAREAGRRALSEAHRDAD